MLMMPPLFVAGVVLFAGVRGDGGEAGLPCLVLCAKCVLESAPIKSAAKNNFFESNFVVLLFLFLRIRRNVLDEFEQHSAG